MTSTTYSIPVRTFRIAGILFIGFCFSLITMGVYAQETPTAVPETPTETPTVIPETPTETPTVVPETPTAIPTATPRPTESPTATPRPTESPTATPRPTESPTATPRPTESPTATPVPVTPKLRAGQAEGRPGDAVVIAITGEDMPTTDAFGFDLTYNNLRLKFAEILRGSHTQGWYAVSAADLSGVLRVVGIAGTAPAISGNGEIAQIRFTIQSNAPEGIVPLDFKVITDDLASAQAISGSITILPAAETPTETPTAVPTETPTFTPTRTATPVPTSTPTLGPIETPTAIPTETPVGTPTVTPTITGTPIPRMDPGQSIIALSAWGDIAALGNIKGFVDVDNNGYLDDPLPHPTGPYPPRVSGYTAFDIANVVNSRGLVTPGFLVMLTEQGKTISYQFVENPFADQKIVSNVFPDLARDVLGRASQVRFVDIEINTALDGYFALSELGRVISVSGTPRNVVANGAEVKPFLASPETAVDLELLPGGGVAGQLQGYILTSTGRIVAIGDVPQLIPTRELRNKGTFIEMDLVLGQAGELLGAVLANGVGEFYLAAVEGANTLPPVDLPEGDYARLLFPLSTPLVLQAFELVPTEETFGIIALDRTGALHTFGRASRYLPTLEQLQSVLLLWGTAGVDLSVHQYPGLGK